MNAFTCRNQAQGGSKPDPLAFFPGVCSGGYLFSSGGPTLQLPSANFYLVVRVHGRGCILAGNFNSLECNKVIIVPHQIIYC